ncbi:MAG: putative bifunctional diguanylate cyclase/phosphodiesterase [Candidatus Dormibacteria bacterium]
MIFDRYGASRSTRRGVRFWIRGAVFVVIAGGIFGALVGLHSWSDQQEAAYQATAGLRAVVAAEHEGVLDPRDPTLARHAATSAALSMVDSSAVPTPARAVILNLTTVFQTAISAEVSAMRLGNASEAAHLEATAGDPAFTALDAELVTVTQQEASSAASGFTISFLASLFIVVFSSLLIFLLARFAALRSARARILAAESAASKLAQESRIAAAREETFRSLFDENPRPLFVTRPATSTSPGGNLQILSANNAALELYGYSRAEFLALTLADIRPSEDRELLTDNLSAVVGGRTHFENIRHSTKAGVLLDVEIDVRMTTFNGETAMIVCPDNVTDRVQLQGELEHQAFHDALTGLPNRSLFGDRLEHAHQRLQRGTGCYAVLMVDLDNFKTVNDSLGHAAGDALLIEVSHRLATAIRPGDTAARLGGDEFAILLEDLVEAPDAALAADRLHDALRAPFSVDGRSLTITATLGIASSLGAGAASDVVRNADVALYVGKANGKDRHDVFSDDMLAAAIERMTLEQDLRGGIGRGELMLMYQPKIAAATGKMKGVEALVRWNHPVRGLVPPDAFIPIAEQSGLINDIDAWVLDAACHQAQRWATSAVGRVPVAVNVSGRSLVASNLLSRVAGALKQTGLDPSLLELEITESAAIPQDSEARALLQQIRDLGVRIAIDDFGTGYSVLSRLQGFPADTLKIDLSFVRAIVSEDEEAPIVDAMIAMGLSLGLTVVAEGVETEVQRAYLAKRGCTELQGYLFSRPVAPEQLAAQVEVSAAAALDALSAA